MKTTKTITGQEITLNNAVDVLKHHERLVMQTLDKVQELNKKVKKLTDPKQYYNIPECAKQLGLTPATVRIYIASGKIRACKLERKIIVSADDLRTFYEEQKILVNE